MPLQSIDPSTDQIIESYSEPDPEEMGRLLERSRQAFEDWRLAPFSHRSSLMKNVAVILRDRAAPCADLMAREMGKPLKDGRSEAEKCAWVCDYFADHAEAFLSPETVQTDAGKSFISFSPLGVVLAIMPWNYPFWQVFRFAAPALMAGNAAVLKHASNVTGCSLAIADIFREAGFPEHLFTSLLISSDRVESIIENPAIRAVTLTGSVRAGKAVASAAGKALKKTVLELGGSDPFIVLEDADLQAAAETGVSSRMLNSGQSCIAAKRFIVAEAVCAEFEQRLVMRMGNQRVGDPRKEGTQVGPLARKDLRDKLHRQITESVNRGARLLLGGIVPEGKGAFYPPTVLTNVKKGMPAFDEETFGPVAAIIKAKDEEDAIRLANDTRYGLGATVFTRDLARGERIATEKLEAGNCFVNDLVRSDPRLPFGGIKDSGYGRELSRFGIREFVNVKTVVVG